jgi:alpha-L-arabinofuranosidase
MRTLLIAENTFENPEKIILVRSTICVNKKFDYVAPPVSLTVISLKMN